MSSSQQPDFERNAHAMRRVINHLGKLGDQCNWLADGRSYFRYIADNAHASASAHEVRIALRTEVVADTQITKVQAADRDFKESLKEPSLSDPAALEAHMDIEEQKLKDLNTNLVQKLARLFWALEARH